MKLSLSLFVALAFCTGLKAQDNPYAVFGHETKVKYATPVSDYLLIKNADAASLTKTLAFNFKTGFVLFLDEKDSILTQTKIEPTQLLRFLSTDPLAKDYPGLAPYAFVANNPINAIDPDGRKILFVNGHYQDNWFGRNVLGADKGGKPYWSSNFATEAQKFFNDQSKIPESNYIDGSSAVGFDMSGQDRYDAGYAYAKANLTTLTADMVKGETFKMVTHSEGAAYGSGIAQYLIDQGYTVETIVHLSADEGDEFSTPTAPMTYQLGYAGDWVTGNLGIQNVDKAGLVNSGLGWQYVHGSTKNGSVFKQVQDLITVRTQDNIGMINGKPAAWQSQVPGTAANKTDFTQINGRNIMKPDGTSKD
jgi:hypothetical protein